jgi:galactose mutarotase-like enzyme
MAKMSWTLTDCEADAYLDELSVGPDDVDGKATGYSVVKRTLRGGRSDGVDVVEIDNGTFRFVVIPTRGMGIWRAALGDLSLGWKSPVQGPVHPALVRLSEPSGIGWLDGFDELLVRCGLESNGAPEFNDDGSLRYPLHGKIANMPAHKLELTIDGDAGEITLSGEVDEARLFGNKLRLSTTYTTRVGQPGFDLYDVVTNLSAEPSELELLYHINLGVPFLSPGSKVVVPALKVAPRDEVAMGNVPEWDTYGPETPGSPEAVFFLELAADAEGNTEVVLQNRSAERGARLRLNKNQLPCFTVWKNRQAVVDGYVTGLEPGINFPNPKSFEKAQGRVAELAPGASRSFEMTLEALGDAASVRAACDSVAMLQGEADPEVLPQPDPIWSPG